MTQTVARRQSSGPIGRPKPRTPSLAGVFAEGDHSFLLPRFQCCLSLLVFVAAAVSLGVLARHLASALVGFVLSCNKNLSTVLPRTGVFMDSRARLARMSVKHGELLVWPIQVFTCD